MTNIGLKLNIFIIHNFVFLLKKNNVKMPFHNLPLFLNFLFDVKILLKTPKKSPETFNNTTINN